MVQFAVSHSTGCSVLLRATDRLIKTSDAELEAADKQQKVKEKSNVAVSAETSFVNTW